MTGEASTAATPELSNRTGEPPGTVPSGAAFLKRAPAAEAPGSRSPAAPIRPRLAGSLHPLVRAAYGYFAASITALRAATTAGSAPSAQKWMK